MDLSKLARIQSLIIEAYSIQAENEILKIIGTTDCIKSLEQNRDKLQGISNVLIEIGRE